MAGATLAPQETKTMPNLRTLHQKTAQKYQEKLMELLSSWDPDGLARTYQPTLDGTQFVEFAYKGGRGERFRWDGVEFTYCGEC